MPTSPVNLMFKSAFLTAIALNKIIMYLVAGEEYSVSSPFKDSFIVGGVDDVVDTDPDEKPEALSGQLSRWLQSDLMSGGLRMSDSTISDFVSDLRRGDAPFRQEHTEISPTDWWLARVFRGTTVPVTISMNDSREDPYSTAAFPMDLDKIILSHTGISPLSKLGGDKMSLARQKVLSALIKHTGVTSLCEAERIAYERGTKSECERPCAILIDIWRAGQRVVEHCIRSKQASSTQISSISFGSISFYLLQKTEFLLSLERNETSLALSRSIQSTGIDLVTQTSKFSNSKSDLQQDVGKLLSDLVEFLQSSFKNVPLLLSRMQQSSSNALRRISGNFLLIYI